MPEFTPDSSEHAETAIPEHTNGDKKLPGVQVLGVIALSDVRIAESLSSPWQTRGLCGTADEHPDAFTGFNIPAAKQRRLIAKYCLNCPVLAQCKIAGAIDDAQSTHDEIIGLQGGLSESSRRLQAQYNKVSFHDGSGKLIIFPIDDGKPVNGLPPLPREPGDRSHRRRELPPVNDEEEISFTELAERLSETNNTISSYVRREGIQIAQHHGPDGLKRSYIARDDIAKLAEVLKARPRKRSRKTPQHSK